MPGPKVFISYSHKDEEWKDRVLTHLGVLQQQGLLDLWDDRRIGAGEDWHQEIEAALNQASVGVLLVTANFLNSAFILDVEVPRLLQRKSTEGVRVFPIIIKPCAWQQVPWLRQMQLRPKDATPLTAGSEYQIDADLAAVANEIAHIVERADRAPTTKAYIPLSPDKISLSRLPSTSAVLFGREAELDALDAAWDHAPLSPTGEARGPKPNILSLVAWGGVGKSALVNAWLSHLESDHYRGAERVYGWSFFSQGASEERQVSADPFIAAALAWFGDADPTQGSPWDKGERLAHLVRQQRTLLVLDGLEPLQNPPPVETGRLKDPALTALLRELAHHNPGLVVLTTRLAVDDLKDFTRRMVMTRGAKQAASSAESASSHSALRAMTAGRAWQLDLDNLSEEAGANYLYELGVQTGSDDERRAASREFAGHALALTLLGTYLKVVHSGDVRQRDKIARLSDEQQQGAHARRVLASYERWLAGRPELAILRLLGLFDRPAERGALDALRKAPAIEGLTDGLQSLGHAAWQYAVSNLRALRLVAEADPHAPDTLDCHPLLREHFGARVRAASPEAWREAHGRLYEYYKASAKDMPETLAEMAPLFAAVAHGCLTGREQAALDEVYWRRIQRGEEFFTTNKLGAFGADLAALAGFFDMPWSQPAAALRDDDKAFVLNQAGFRLRALGRLAEAAQPMQAGLELQIAQEKWMNAARIASNLSELYLTIGDVPRAVETARQSVELADRSGDAFLRMGTRTTLADALHQAGQIDAAAARFQEAEAMQSQDQPEFPQLYSVQGYQYCDLLLTFGQHAEVQRRAGQTLEWYTQASGASLLAIALDHLALGRAHLAQALSWRAADGRAAISPRMTPQEIGAVASLPRTDEAAAALSLAAEHLQQAVEGLRRAGDQDMLPLGLLARAELHAAVGELERAQRDVDEAFTIASRGGMRLHLADCHLAQARLWLARARHDAAGRTPDEPIARARAELAAAQQLIAETGYQRREPEAAALAAALDGAAA